MRVLFYYLAAGGSGGYANMLLLLRALMRVNDEDRLLLVVTEGMDVAGLASLPCVEIVRFPVKRLDYTRVMLGIRGLNAIAESWRADVVWAMEGGSYRRFATPQVLSVHNWWSVAPWSEARHHPRGWLRVAMIRCAFRLTLRASSGAIVQTKDMQRQLLRFRQVKSVAIPKAVEGIDDVKNEPLPASIEGALRNPSKWFTFLYTATWSDHKNHRILIDALAQLVARNVAVRVVLTVQAEDLRRVSHKSAALIDAGRLIPLGWVGKPWLRALYEAADACVMPSRFESLSSSHLEAMEWEKPQIVADLPYARTLCENAAMYAGVDAADEWAAAMEELSVDPTLRELLISRGRLRLSAVSSPSWLDAAHRLRSFLHDAVISATGARVPSRNGAE